MQKQPAVPIKTAHLFSKLEGKLLKLLESLSPEDWDKPAVKKWTVKDAAAHLLDGNIRHLSMLRDNYWGLTAPAANDMGGLTAWLNGLNAEWITAMKRVSPALLIEMHKLTGPQFCKHIASLPPFEKAAFPVTWAGESESLNWMHVAREYTERWHHQQQIRDAVGRQGIMTKELFVPFIKTYMLALPHTYRNTSAPDRTCVRIKITTGIGGTWLLKREQSLWRLIDDNGGKSASEVILDPSTAWKLFSKNIRADEITSGITIIGDIILGRAALEMVSVMA